jgi:hypothetical protein
MPERCTIIDDMMGAAGIKESIIKCSERDKCCTVEVDGSESKLRK